MGATLDAREELVRSKYDILIVPSATRRMRHLGTSLENTSQFLHTLSNEELLPGIVIVILESKDHTGRLLAHQVNGCVMHEISRHNAEDMPDLLNALIRQHLQ